MARRRFFQISLRTLLGLTTLVAIGLAAFTHLQQRILNERVAVARIVALEGQVVYDYETKTIRCALVKPPPPGWPWLRKLIGNECFQDVVNINLDGTLVTDADLTVIGKLKGVRSLSLSGLERPGPSWHLRSKNREGLRSQLTSTGISRLGAQPDLVAATLAHTPLDDAGMEYIAQWRSLEVLSVEGTEITSAGIEKLTTLPKLTRLNLKNTKIDDGAVESLGRVRKLDYLGVTATAMTGAGLLALHEKRPDCDIEGSFMDLSGGVDADPESMRWKEVTRHMKRLDRGQRLKLIDLAATAITDLHLPEMDRLENVEVIDLRRTKVTAAGVETLQRALPKCKIVWP